MITVLSAFISICSKTKHVEQIGLRSYKTKLITIKIITNKFNIRVSCLEIIM